MQIKLLDAATAVNSEPTVHTDGFELRGALLRQKPGDEAVIVVRSTAGSATMTVTLKLWGYSYVSESWSPLGTSSTPDNKGLLNDGSAIAEGPVADFISHAEVINGLRHFDKVYVEVHAIGGTLTAVSAWLLAK